MNSAKKGQSDGGVINESDIRMAVKREKTMRKQGFIPTDDNALSEIFTDSQRILNDSEVLPDARHRESEN